MHLQIYEGRTHEVHEAARSAACELRYEDVKPEQLRVVEAFVQGRNVFYLLAMGNVCAMDAYLLSLTN